MQGVQKRPHKKPSNIGMAAPACHADAGAHPPVRIVFVWQNMFPVPVVVRVSCLQHVCLADSLEMSGQVLGACFSCASFYRLHIFLELIPK